MHKFEKLEERLSLLEKWRWMFVGGALVVGYLLAHIKY
jgi:hypothetical protein